MLFSPPRRLRDRDIRVPRVVCWCTKVYTDRILERQGRIACLPSELWRQSVVVYLDIKKMSIGWRVPRRGEHCVAERRQRRHNGVRSHEIASVRA